MRILMLFSMGFCASTAICVYAAWNDPVLWLELAAASLCLGIACAFLRKHLFSVISVFLIGVTVGSLWYWGYDSLYLRHARSMDQQTCFVTVEATDYPRQTDYGIQAEGKLSLNGKTYPAVVYVNDEHSLKPGDQIQGSFHLRYTAAGSEKDGTYHAGEGILFLCYPRGEIKVKEGDSSRLAFFSANLRHQVLDRIARVFPKDTAAFASALLLGEDDGLSYEENTALKLSGIRHVVAVSGQHLLILMAAVDFLTGRRKLVAMGVSVPLLILFSAVSGMNPSIVRALIMQLLVILAFFVSEEYDGLTALAFSALCMVVANPMAVTSVSLQLSTASVLGMLLFYENLYKRMRGWYFFQKIKPRSWQGQVLHGVLSTVCGTLTSMVFAIPLSGVYFKTVSLVSVVTNLLTLWLITLVFYGVIMVVILGFLWIPVGMLAAWLLSFPMRFVLWISGLLAKLPMGCLYLRDPVVIAAVICCFCIGILWLLWDRVRLWSCACLMSGILAVGMVICWMAPLEDHYRITMLDVGQGQCILLQSGKKTFVVDCGGDYDKSVADTAAETLLSMGISRLDGLILTHFDDDHAGAVPYLLSRMEVDTLILPEAEDLQMVLDMGKLCDGEVIYLNQDLVTSLPNGQLSIFVSNAPGDDNEKSLCVLFQAENCDILITGDRSAAAEVALLESHQLPKLEYLVAGHHGSANSTGDILLKATRPDTVLISVGAENRYGHPQQALLQRLEKYGCRIRRTDLEGTIVIRG